MVLSRLDGNFLVGWPIWGNSRRSHSFTYSELDSPASLLLTLPKIRGHPGENISQFV